MIELIHGDAADELKKLESNSVDALLTDPPAGIGFMGKEWDHHKGGRSEWIAWLSGIMRECHRVLKPGGHGLVWAIPRTSHWTATALEDAGFEVRDVITHLFGQGFPKSLDIYKAIDKAEREVVGVYQSPEGTSGRSDGSGSGFGIGGLNQITAPATDAAKQWSGWGTALKPASEHWILVRKPCSEKTVAENVLKWGTGGINIDASRIDAKNRRSPTGADGLVHRTTGNSYGEHKKSSFNINQGRFPANLVLSHSPHCTDAQCDIECAIKALDEQSGISKPNAAREGIKGGNGGPTSWSGLDCASHIGKWPADPGGGASRFFYCAKISTSERGEGNNHPTVKPKKLMGYLCRMVTPPNGTILDPFMGSGSTGIAAKVEGFKFIGIEKDANYFDIARNRIGES